MIPPLLQHTLREVREHFVRLYGDQADRCTERFALLAGRYGLGLPAVAPPRPWTARDAVLIAYPDHVHAAGEPPLATLARFARARLGDAFSTVHLLPFFPSSSDDGFSVVHFRQVDPAYGRWAEIQQLAANYRVMADLVLNHASRQSGWFEDFTLGVAPACRYFVTADPRADLSAVVRPRTHPLLTPVETRAGRQHVWTTFSADQVDLDYRNPDLLFEMLDLLLFYVAQGARVIRLDAVAFLWKEIGTPCLHAPQVHEVVRLMRRLLNLVAPDVWLITETNVPHAENVAYFGAGDQAHLVYQFSLPPLLLHAVVNEDATALSRWLATLDPPPPGCTFLNFTASHDGIGVRPLEGLAPAGAVAQLAAHVEGAGGQVSRRSHPDGTTTPYELNCTWYDALGGATEEERIARFLCTHAVLLALAGVPALYFNSLFAAPNDQAGAQQSGRARTLNRHKWVEAEIDSLLGDAATPAARVLPALLHLLRVRGAQPAFHPDAAQTVPDFGRRILAVERTGGGQRVLAVHNLSGHAVPLPPSVQGRDLVSGQRITPGATLPPWGVHWIELA